MTCEQAIALISARMDREIQSDDHAWLELHLKECEACRATADAFELQHGELTDTFEPRRLAAAMTAERVNAQLPDAVEAVPKKARPAPPLFRYAAIAAAVAAVVAPVIVSSTFRQPNPRVAVSIPPGNSTAVYARQDKLLPRPLPEAAPGEPAKVGAVLHTAAGERRRATLPDGSTLYVNQNTTVRLEEARKLKLDAGEVFVEVSPRPPGQTGATFTVEANNKTYLALGTKFAVQADGKGSDLLVSQGKVKVEDHGAETVVHNGFMLHDRHREVLAVLLRDDEKPGVNTAEPAERVSKVLDWTRDLMASAEVALVPASRYDGGALIAVDPSGQEAKLSLRKYHVDVHIEDGFARTTIDQTYFNHHPWRLEGTFYFPLPPDASLSRLAMYVDGHLMEGGMAERQYARQVYDRIVSSQRDPALLEWVDGTTFKMRVFPLEGRQEKRIVLSYTQRLPSLYGKAQYRFPAGHSLQVVNEWSFNALVKNGAALHADSPTNPRIKAAVQGVDLVLTDEAKLARVDHDVVLDLTNAAKENGEKARFSRADFEGKSYFMLRFRPELHTEAKQQRRDWVFLYESSADRDPLLARVQIEIIRTLLDNAEHDDTFQILTAGTTVHAYAEKPLPATPDNVKAAMDFLDHTHLIGALDLGHGFAAAAAAAKDSKNPYLVHVGSGITHMGVGQHDLLDHLPKGMRYVGVGVGKHYDRSFMKQAAERTGGYCTQINPDEPITWRAFDLLATLNTPQLLNVQVVEKDEVKDDPKAPRFLVDNPSISQGEEVCAVARLVPPGGVEAEGAGRVPETLVVTGLLDGTPYREEIKVANVADHADYLPRTWAKLEIDRMLAQNADTNVQRIIDLSKAMYVMTPYTSLLVLENEDMFKQFNVDRGRKDHWALYPCADTIPVVYEPDPTQPVDVRNAPKGAKPSANQVLQTMLVRVPPRWLDCGNDHSQTRGSVVTAVEIYSGAYAMVDELNDMSGANKLGRIDEPRLSKRAKLNSTIIYAPIRPTPEGLEHFGLTLGNERLEGGRIAFNGYAGAETTGRVIDDFVDADGEGWVLESRHSPLRAGLTTFGKVAKGKKEDLNELSPLTGVPVHYALAKNRVFFDQAGEVDLYAWGDGLEQTGKNYSGRREREAAQLAAGRRLNERGTIGLDFAYSVDAVKLQIQGLDDSAQALGFRGLGTLGIGQKSVYSRQLGSGRTGFDGEQPPSATAPFYERIYFSEDQRLFTDLLAYAPGLNTSRADIQAVLEDEAAPELRNAPGHIDPAARLLIDQARKADWQSYQFDKEKNASNASFAFDGSGRFVSERTLPLGLRETVVCDGDTLLSLYPELGLAASRPVTRFHRAALMAAVPWLTPPAADMAHGADVELVKDHTVAVIPHAVKNFKPTEGKEQPRYARLQLVFEGDRLAERQIVVVPDDKVLGREVYDGKGGVRYFDADGNEQGKFVQPLAAAQAPDLRPDTKALVVLPLPFRSRQHAFAAFGLDVNRSLDNVENGCYADLAPHQAVQLLAALFAQGAANEARLVVRDCFLRHNDRRQGLFTLLLASGVNVGNDPDCVPALSAQAKQPLARYILLHGNHSYQVLHSRWPLNLGTTVDKPDCFLGRLAEFYDLTLRDPSLAPLLLSARLRKADQIRYADFIRRNKTNVLGWAMLTHVQDRRASRTWVVSQQYKPWLAAEWDVIARALHDDPHARYEQADCLTAAKETTAARELFLKLYTQDLKAGFVPAIDGRFRAALLADDKRGEDLWTPLIQHTAEDFLKKNQRGAVIALATQCQRLGDRPLADNLMKLALGDLEEEKKTVLDDLMQIEEYRKAKDEDKAAVTNDAVLARQYRVTVAAIGYYRQNGDNARAEALADGLLAGEPFVRSPSLWRLDSAIADDLGATEKAVRCLEHALDLEFADLPEVIDLQAWRRDYGRLLDHYRSVVGNAQMQHQAPPGDIAARTIRAVDRWRKHDPEASGACQTASEILKRIGASGIAWEYLTTAEGKNPTNSSTWFELGHRSQRQGDFETADRAYAVAAEADPKNALILWDRAQNKAQAGDVAGSNKILRQIADTPWESPYQNTRANALRQLGR